MAAAEQMSEQEPKRSFAPWESRQQKDEKRSLAYDTLRVELAEHRANKDMGKAEKALALLSGIRTSARADIERIDTEIQNLQDRISARKEQGAKFGFHPVDTREIADLHRVIDERSSRRAAFAELIQWHIFERNDLVRVEVVDVEKQTATMEDGWYIEGSAPHGDYMLRNPAKDPSDPGATMIVDRATLEEWNAAT